MRRTSWVAVLLVIVLGSAVGVGAGSFLAWWLPLAHKFHMGAGEIFGNPFGGKEVVHMLMMGEDNSARGRKGGHGLSDTLVVLAINTRTKEVRAISIPRDTRVEIPGHGTCKINSANVYGGPQLAKQVVQDLLGTQIDYYVATSTQGLRGLVDLVGGVYIVVDKKMDYDDNHQNLHIHLRPKYENGKPVKQLLNGVEAEGFVRFRHDRIGDSGFDIVDGKKVPAGRIVRQQYFMRSLANRILSIPSKRDRADVLEKAYEKHYIESDLNLKDWDGLADYFKDIKPENMVMSVLPGAPGNVHGASYWLPDYEKVRELVAENLNFQKPAASAESTEDLNASVEVLNGSGISNVATKVADKLKEAGFQVTRTGNAPSFDYNRCQVITHKGKNAPAERIAKLLNCNDIKDDTGSEGAADVTVIVGRDFSE